MENRVAIAQVERNYMAKKRRISTKKVGMRGSESRTWKALARERGEGDLSGKVTG
jgi:hypothetical protein